MADKQDVLKRKKLFVLDMDGTFYLGNRLLEGSLDFLDKLKANGVDFLFFTNNSSRTAPFYTKKLESMGCLVDEGSIVTSGDVTIRFIMEHYRDAGVYLVGTDLLKESFAHGGVKLTDDSPDIVVLGFDTSLTYEKIERACYFIRKGAIFIATHPDLNCPTEDGFIPDCGSMCALVTASTGVEPRYLGKPFRETVDMIKLLTGRNDDEIAFVGDRLYTDIAIGVNNGITSILVLTGETSPADVECSQIKPDFIFDSLYALGQAL
ncbi:MAG: HAD-IIA family hydrolase [Clostridiaceae bacterium]|jgi:4-nitrophenyl phosphatase|nr:HAD-IIA family hydrolase [Clostridiaceae bacterium]